MKPKGGAPVTRQNFSLHPTLMKAVLETANHFNQIRSIEIIQKRSRRVTYSKVVASLAWLLKTEYLDSEGKPTQKLLQLVQDYENSEYEQYNVTPGKEEGEDDTPAPKEPIRKAQSQSAKVPPKKPKVNNTKPKR